MQHRRSDFDEMEGVSEEKVMVSDRTDQESVLNLIGEASDGLIQQTNQ